MTVRKQITLCRLHRLISLCALSHFTPYTESFIYLYVDFFLFLLMNSVKDDAMELRPPPTCRTLAMTVDDLLKQEHLVICSVLKDGFCLVQACSQSTGLTKDVIVQKLRKEIMQNLSEYKAFFTREKNIILNLNVFLNWHRMLMTNQQLSSLYVLPGGFVE
jgi:hypothetical protein